MKGKASPINTKLLDKAIWNPRPVIDLLSRAVTAVFLLNPSVFF